MEKIGLLYFHHLGSIDVLENVTEISNVGTILVSDQIGIKKDDPDDFRGHLLSYEVYYF